MNEQGKQLCCLWWCQGTCARLTPAACLPPNAVIDETADIQTAVSSILVSKVRHAVLLRTLCCARDGALRNSPPRPRGRGPTHPPASSSAHPQRQTFDNGVICASEQSVVVVDSVYNKVRAEMVRRGCYFLKDEAEKDKVGQPGGMAEGSGEEPWQARQLPGRDALLA